MRAAILKDAIKGLTYELDKAQNELAQLQRNCHHQWGSPSYAPIVQEAGSSPGDPEGTMGVDRQLPCSWPRSETPRWKRVCCLCLKEEYTTKSEPVISRQNPIF